jgi:PadR family transcriptional regulator, regulatory protein PadR
MEELTSLETVVLAALADRARYGYELAQRVEELTEGSISVRPGNLYRILYRLTERGLAEELEGAAGEDERRRYYSATVRGKKAAAAQLSMHARVLRRSPDLRGLLADG